MKRTVKEVYTGLSVTRTAVECAPLLDASKIQGATKTEDWQERTINETMGLGEGEITITPSSPTQDARRDNYWKNEF